MTKGVLAVAAKLVNVEGTVIRLSRLYLERQFQRDLYVPWGSHVHHLPKELAREITIR